MTGVHHHSQIFTGWDVDLTNFLPRQALNPSLPSLGLHSSWDYSCEPLHPAYCSWWYLRISKPCCRHQLLVFKLIILSFMSLKNVLHVCADHLIGLFSAYCALKLSQMLIGKIFNSVLCIQRVRILIVFLPVYWNFKFTFLLKR
jgi:hypothetical protein